MSIRSNPVPPPLATLKGLRCLVVDDHAENRFVAREILQLEGAEVSLASSGAMAVEWCLREPLALDLVLMDLQMPGVRGDEAIRKIRRVRDETALPIVILTADLNDLSSAVFSELKVLGVLIKPVDPQALRALLAKVPGKD